MKILIVDDEKMTRDSLVDFMPWNDLGITQIQTAKNGLSALALVQGDAPDIILCDIKMPKMDGITFLEKVQALSIHCQMIFISGYSDKEYLKKAISLGAASYIEKPINMEELARELAKAVEQRRRRLQELESTRRLADIHEKNLPATGQRIVLALLQPHLSGGCVRRQFGDVFSWADRGHYRALCAIVCDADNQPPDPEREHCILERIHDLLDDQALAGFAAPGHLAVLTADPTADPRALGKALIERLNDRGLLASVGAAGPTHALSRLYDSFQDAVRLAQRRFYCGCNRVFACKGGPAYAQWEETASRLGLMFQEGRWREARQTLEETSQLLLQNQPVNIHDIQEMYYRILVLALDSVWDGDPLEREKLLRRACAQRELHAMEAMLLEVIDGHLARQEQQGGGNPRISQAIAQINTRYGDKALNVRQIAAELSLSPNYFSYLFRRETGMNANEYINRVRVRRAKQLLRDTDKKLYEVAGEVGFSDPNYFGVVYKRLEGRSPLRDRES